MESNLQHEFINYQYLFWVFPMHTGWLIAFTEKNTLNSFTKQLKTPRDFEDKKVNHRLW